MQEAHQNVIYLLDDDLDTIERVVQFMYCHDYDEGG